MVFYNAEVPTSPYSLYTTFKAYLLYLTEFYTYLGHKNITTYTGYLSFAEKLSQQNLTAWRAVNRSCIAVQRLAWAVQTELIRMRVLFTWLKSTSINVPGIKKNTFFAIQRPNHTQNYNEASISFHKGNGPIYFYLCTFIFDIVWFVFFFKGNLQNHLIHKIQFVEGLGWRVKKWLLLLSVVLSHMERSFCCIRFHSLALLIGVYITCFFRFGNKAL